MRKRILQLDGLRGIAILSVFVHHALRIPLLWIGVDLFFVLSGFLITGILLDRLANGSSYFSYFYARRARRILPAYVLMLISVTIVQGAAWLKGWYFYAFFAMNIGASFYETSMPVLWSLAVEEQFYLFWPFVVKYLSPKRMLVAALALIGLAPLLRAVCTPLFDSSFPIYFLTPFRMDTLASGAVLAYIWRFHRGYFDRCSTLAGAFILSGLTGLLAISHFVGRKEFNTLTGNVWIYECTLAISVAAVMLGLRGRGLTQAILLFPPLRYIGVISYSMYLIHKTVTDTLEPLIHSHVLFFLTSLAVTCSYASLSWFILERPIIAHKSEPASAGVASSEEVDSVAAKRRSVRQVQ